MSKVTEQPTIELGKLKVTGDQLRLLLSRLDISIYKISEISGVAEQTISDFINARQKGKNKKIKAINTDTWNRVVDAMIKIRNEQKGVSHV